MLVLCVFAIPTDVRREEYSLFRASTEQPNVLECDADLFPLPPANLRAQKNRIPGSEPVLLLDAHSLFTRLDFTSLHTRLDTLLSFFKL